MHLCLASGALRGIPWISSSVLPLFRKQPRLYTFGSLAPPQISTETLKRKLKMPWGRKDQSQDSDIYHQDDCAVRNVISKVMFHVRVDYE